MIGRLAKDLERNGFNLVKLPRMMAGKFAYREDDGNATTNSSRTIQDGSFTQPQLLIARSILPAGDGGAVQQNMDTLASGEHGRDSRVVMGDVNLSLRGRGRCGGESRRLIWSVHCDDGSSRVDGLSVVDLTVRTLLGAKVGLKLRSFGWSIKEVERFG